jgi:uncharacterized repeat protein (TIGR03803 family)
VDGGAGNEGVVFKITPSGTLTTLHSFCVHSGCLDGAGPYAGLVQATDGNLYGTTAIGGLGDKCDFHPMAGTVFTITTSGTLTTLYDFGSAKGDGDCPQAGLVQDTNSIFYGTTYAGGGHDSGTVYSLSVGLGPFIKTLPISGKVGARVKILGTSLIGATSVAFNGTPAVFKVATVSEITTTVPAGTTTGTVQVVTPSGTLASNVPFQVP